MTAPTLSLAAPPGRSARLSQIGVGLPPHVRARLRWFPLACLCFGILGVLVGWAVLFPYTGDGDAVLHYQSARYAAVDVTNGLHSWSRPLFKLPLAVFAARGVLAARAFVAGVSAVVVWQTVRLAEDLRLPRAALAGPLVLAQPMAFAVAADTMTEMPMALGLVIAVRLWLNRRPGWSCLVIGFLPAVRPEGFFFGCLWGAMVLATPGPWWRRGEWLVVLSLGLLTWSAACARLTGDPLLVVHAWDWPAGSYASYGRGPLWHYAVGWPVYAGLPVTVLCAAGLPWALRCRRAWLPAGVWAVVFLVHSVLYWRGWFASCGLLRILACTSPFTAVVALAGWNRLCRRRWAAALIGTAAVAWTAGQYCLTPEHYETFPLRRCTAYVRDHGLLATHPWFFAGNDLATADLGLMPRSNRLMELPCDPTQTRARLAALPVGSVGVWDDRQAQTWHGLTTADLAGLGFDVVYDTATRFGSIDMRYAVVRKVRPTQVTVPRSPGRR